MYLFSVDPMDRSQISLYTHCAIFQYLLFFISDPREPPGPLGLLHTSSTRFNQDRSLESPGKLTTWSNLSKSPSGFQQSPPQPVIWQSRNREELNNNSASDAAENYDRYKPFHIPYFRK